LRARAVWHRQQAKQESRECGTFICYSISLTRNSMNRGR
jgi:hypothetical protein